MKTLRTTDLIHSFEVNAHKFITMNHISPETSLWAHFCHRQYGSGFRQYDVVALKPTAFGTNHHKMAIMLFKVI